APVAVWQGPDAPELEPEVVRRLDAAAAVAFGARLEELHEVESLVHAFRPSEPHWYLGMIGTVAHRRRQGCGTAVLRPVLDHLDHVGGIAYLETSAPENLDFYARLGFAVVAGLDRLPHGAPPIWGMQRRPARPVEA
ncbi:MAG: GNAT family N-acetyltransferase, partial [Acidimicrobiia bacterium]